MKNLNVIFVHGWLFDSKIWWGLDNEFNDFKSVSRQSKCNENHLEKYIQLFDSNIKKCV